MSDYPSVIEEQRAYFAKKARNLRTAHLLLRSLIVLAGVSTTAVLAVKSSATPEWLPAILAGLTSLLTGLDTLHQPKDRWISFRAAAERLRSEHRLFQASLLHYDCADEPRRTAVFAQRCEQIINATDASFQQIVARC